MPDRERGAEFRKRAEESLAFGAALEDGLLREWAADIEATYFRMADHLDKNAAIVRAVQMPVQPPEARDMAAAVAPVEEPTDKTD